MALFVWFVLIYQNANKKYLFEFLNYQEKANAKDFLTKTFNESIKIDSALLQVIIISLSLSFIY